jgi:glycosyltransferase involved in cell wall biosynthesis
MKKSPRIAILMCTFNGDQYLEAQLDSIYNQDYKNWTLFVSDDSSKDKTLSILKTYQMRWGKDKLHILKGPSKSFQSNFLSIITNKKIKADLYFLCDQDDIWMPHKLSHTIKKLSKLPLRKPHLYCGRTTYSSRDGKRILGMSELFSKPPSFRNAIIQSIAGGNTMAFNNDLKKIASLLGKIEIVSHDWWLYILNELSGGKTLYDSESTILYRQHNRSLIGANTSIFAKLKRLNILLNGTYRAYNTRHLNILIQNRIPTTNANTKVIHDFFIKRDKGIVERLRMIQGLDLYCQTTERQIAIYLGAALNKV